MLDAIVLALALAMDAAAIAAACGAIGLPPDLVRRMAWMFALFHVAMATIGWMVGALAATSIAAWDHWVVLGLLSIVGGKMMLSALRPGALTFPATWSVLVALALASSIDAVAAGVTLPLVETPELVTIALIGGVVYVLTLAGARVGAILGAKFGRVLQIVGGLALIALGVKSVVEHLR